MALLELKIRLSKFLLDEINLSKNLNNLNNGLSYFAPNLNHSIGAELTNFIFLKNNLEKVNTDSFSSNISYKNINQSNMNFLGRVV